MQIFICGWWLCPELYLRRPFHAHASSRLDDLLEAKAKQGVQVIFSWFIIILTMTIAVSYKGSLIILIQALVLFF